MPTAENDTSREEVDALCPECGRAFKAFVDRLVKADDATDEKHEVHCPVCGCTDCKIGK